MIERTSITAGLAAILAACSGSEPAANATLQVNLPDAVVVNGPTEDERIPPLAKPTAGREPIAYTSLKPADCKLIEQNLEEGGYSRHLCKGVAGYSIETSESDLRQSLAVIGPGGRRNELDLSSRVAKGAFNALGPAAEWRGQSRASPTAVIVRLNVAKPEPKQPDTSNLIVISLRKASCIAVVPPGPDQNVKARKVADTSPPVCNAN